MATLILTCEDPNHFDGAGTEGRGSLESATVPYEILLRPQVRKSGTGDCRARTVLFAFRPSKKNFAKDLNNAKLMSRKEEPEPAAESGRGLHSGKQKDCGGLNMGR